MWSRICTNGRWLAAESPSQENRGRHARPGLKLTGVASDGRERNQPEPLDDGCLHDLRGASFCGRTGPADATAPPRGPDPAGTIAEVLDTKTPEAATAQGIGIDGEETVWEASYAMRNFMGRIVVRGIISLAWLGFAAYAWGYRAENDLGWLVTVLGIGVGLLWVTLLYRMLQAHYGHHYRLTTRRLFVSSGLLQRRRDMMELLSVKDVFTRQSLAQPLDVARDGRRGLFRARFTRVLPHGRSESQGGHGPDLAPCPLGARSPKREN